MRYCIENEFLKIEADSMGAELMSVYSKKTNTEYLWQGDEKYWKNRALNLFPFIGRMYENVFRYEGKTYPSRPHGLARYFEFALESQTKNSLTFLLTDNEETKKEYPFSFEFRVTFILNGMEVVTRYAAKNTGATEMLCAFGGHPGFNIPFGKGCFEDYYLDFGEKTAARRQLLSESDRYMADKAVPYELENGVALHLKHELFTHDAIILENTSNCVSVRSDKDSRYITMKYSDFRFIGFWQANTPDTPYICLEPWTALPSVDGKITELESKPHMTRVAPNNESSVEFTFEIHE